MFFLPQILFPENLLVCKTALHRHFILGQGTGLIGAYHAHRPQRLYGRKLPDNRMYLYHFGDTQGQTDGNYCGKPLGHRRHCQGYGGNQHFNQIPFLEQRYHKEGRTQKQRQKAQYFSQFSQPLLQRRELFMAFINKGCDFSDLRIHTCGSHNPFPSAIGHNGGHESHIIPIP